MPAKNAERYIRQALESFQSQTLADFELFVVDDQSIDQTAAFVRNWQEQDARVCLLANAGNGVSAARNTGIQAASADIIAFADADDIQREDRLELQLACFDENLDVIACGTSMERFHSEGEILGYSRPSFSPKSDLHGFPIVVAHIPMPTLAVRYAELTALGGFDTSFPVAEDIDIVLKLEERGSLRNLPDPAVRYRIHAQSTSSRHPYKCSQFAGMAMAKAYARRSGHTHLESASKISDLPLSPDDQEIFEAQIVVSYLNSLNRNVKPWTESDEAAFSSIQSLLEKKSPNWIKILSEQRVP